RSTGHAIATGRRSARLEGFSLHADVAVPARRRDQLERLVRYLVRPPLALDHLTESGADAFFTTSGVHGATAPRRSYWLPLALLGWLSAVVPPPRRPLVAYHGLLAPRARWRSPIVPKPSPAGAGAAAPVSGRGPWARLLRRVFGC